MSAASATAPPPVDPHQLVAFATFRVGDAVSVTIGSTAGSVRRRGIVRYVGKVNGTTGTWYGVELEHADGVSDGVFLTQRFFACAKNHALFVRHDALHPVASATSVPASPAATAAANAVFGFPAAATASTATGAAAAATAAPPPMRRTPSSLANVQYTAKNLTAIQKPFHKHTPAPPASSAAGANKSQANSSAGANNKSPSRPSSAGAGAASGVAAAAATRQTGQHPIPSPHSSPRTSLSGSGGGGASDAAAAKQRAIQDEIKRTELRRLSLEKQAEKKSAAAAAIASPVSPTATTPRATSPRSGGPLSPVNAGGSSTDAAAATAALAIQSQWRGSTARKEVRQMAFQKAWSELDWRDEKSRIDSYHSLKKMATPSQPAAAGTGGDAKSGGGKDPAVTAGHHLKHKTSPSSSLPAEKGTASGVMSPESKQGNEKKRKVEETAASSAAAAANMKTSPPLTPAVAPANVPPPPAARTQSLDSRLKAASAAAASAATTSSAAPSAAAAATADPLALPVTVPNPLTLEYALQCMDTFQSNKTLPRSHVMELLKRVAPVFRAEPNVVHVPIHLRVTVCGDLHGQLDDLFAIFQLNGLPSESNVYVFNGDFVDRGAFSCEVVLLLIIFKLLYPSEFHMNRGNHEARDINQMFSFERELAIKYPIPTTHAARASAGAAGGGDATPSNKVFDAFQHVFSCLPLCTILEHKIIVVHGGLFWHNTTLKQIDEIDRFHQEIPRDSLQEQMLWSDPWNNPGRGVNSRGCALCYGADVVDEFLDTNHLQLIVRSHECVPNGYATLFDNTLLTVFSASNYLHCDNDGAYVVFEKNCEAHVVTYRAGPKESAARHRNTMENHVIAGLVQHISDNRLGLVDYYRSVESKDTRGCVTRLQWATGLSQVLGFKEIPFLNFQTYLGLPERGVTGDDGSDTGLIDYTAFLSRFRPSNVLLKRAMSLPTAQPPSQMHKPKGLHHSAASTASATAAAAPATPIASASGAAAAAAIAAASKTSDEPVSAQQSIEHLVEVLSKNRYALESLFRHLDSNCDGVLNKREMTEGIISLHKLLNRTYSEKEIENLIHHIDTNQDGIVSYEEFCASFIVIDPTVSKQQIESVNEKTALLRRTSSVLSAMRADNKWYDLQQHNRQSHVPPPPPPPPPAPKQ